MFWFPKAFGHLRIALPSAVNLARGLSRIQRIQIHSRGDLSVLKKLILLAGIALALATQVSAVIPWPPCNPCMTIEPTR